MQPLAGSIRNIESAWSFDIFVDCPNDGLLTLQQWLTTSKRLVAASDDLSSDLTLTTSIDQVSYSRVCSVKDHLT